MSVKIKCSHILVAKQSEALTILDRIKNGEKFGKLAKDLSTDYFTKGKMVKPFEDAAFKLQVGQVSEPVKTEYGYHIIKRLG
jgi:foldase protein PrsA